MSSSTFVCPECDTALRGADKVPAGKKVKCPSCAAVFVMPVRKNPDVVVGIREKPPLSSPRPGRDASADEAPRTKRRSRDDEETGDDDARPRRKARATADDDVVTEEYIDEEYREKDEEVEDQPRKKRRKKRKAVRRGGGKGLLIGLIVGGTLLLAGVGFGLFYFIMRSGGGGEPLAYIPADFDVVMGTDEAALANDPTIGAAWKRLIQAGNANIMSGMQSANALGPGDVESSIVAFKVAASMGGNALGAGGPMGGLPPMISITKFKKPFDKKLSAQNLRGASPTKLSGKEIYELNDPLIKTVYMPSNRIVIATNLQGAQLEPVLKSDGKTLALSADMLAAIRGLEKNTIWAVASIDGRLRSNLEAEIAKDPPPPELKPLVDAALKANRVSFWGKLDANRLNLNLALNCPDANTATQLAGQMEAAWNQAKGELAKLELVLVMLPKTKQFLSEITTGLQFSAQGSAAQMTTSMSKQALNDMFQELMNFMPGFGAGGAGMVPGGGMGPGGGMPGGGKGGMPGGGPGRRKGR